MNVIELYRHEQDVIEECTRLAKLTSFPYFDMYKNKIFAIDVEGNIVYYKPAERFGEVETLIQVRDMLRKITGHV